MRRLIKWKSIELLSEMKENNPYTWKKVAVPSFTQGVGSILSIAGNYYNVENMSDPNEDAKSIASDWSVVGYEILDSKSKLQSCKK